MRSIKAVMQDAALARWGRMTDHQREIAQEFYEAIEGWRDGFLTLQDVLDITHSWYIRSQIIAATSNDHPLWRDIMNFCDAYWKATRGPGIETRHGWFSEEEIQQHGGKIIEVFDRETNLVEIAAVFPTSYEKGIDGKIDKERPIYGQAPKLHPDPRDIPHQKIKPAGFDFWMNDLTRTDGLK